MKQQALQKKPLSKEAVLLNRLKTAQRPSAEDIEALKQLISEKPGVWYQLGDMMQQSRDHYVRELNADTLAKEAVKFHIEEMTKTLSHEQDGLLEKLLIEQLAFCWVRLSIMEQQYTNVMKGSHTLTLGLYWEKRLTAAHKRYRNACESLARVRKLLRPSLRMNVAIVNPSSQRAAQRKELSLP
jgi:hypothetical protein